MVNKMIIDNMANKSKLQAKPVALYINRVHFEWLRFYRSESKGEVQVLEI